MPRLLHLLRLRRISSVAQQSQAAQGLTVARLEPALLPRFRELGVRSGLLANITAAFPVVCEPTQVQEIAIPTLLRRSRENAHLVAAETGSGKSLAFLVPLVQRLKDVERTEGRISAKGHPRGLILVPTRELGVQVLSIVKALTRPPPRGIPSSADADFRMASHGLLGVTKMHLQRKWLEENLVDIVVATPGRLLELIETRLVSVKALREVVIDEADTMVSGRGFSFENQALWKILFRERKKMNPIHVTYVGATVQDYVVRKLQVFHPSLQVIRTKNLHKVSHGLVKAEFVRIKGQPNGKLAELRNALGDVQVRGKKALVFTNTSRSCQYLLHQLPLFLSSDELEAVVGIHGDSRGEDRLDAWMKFRSPEHPKIRVGIATDVTARGLDDPDIETVILFEFPAKQEDYLHRIGRIRRSGTVIALVSGKEEAFAREVFLKHVKGLSFEDAKPEGRLDQVSKRKGSWRESSECVHLPPTSPGSKSRQTPECRDQIGSRVSPPQEEKRLQENQNRKETSVKRSPNPRRR